MSTSVEESVEEFLELCRQGKDPDMKSFIAARPEQAAELSELLPLLMEMETAGAARQTRRAEETEIPELPGTDFQLISLIGQGGMGSVWKALQRSLDRVVAVKLLAPSLLADDRQREQFETEARVIARLHHPGIVKVISAGTAGDRCFYAMELIDGQGLDRRRPEDLRTVARLGLEAAEALHYAHSCGVLHRDIKPANLLLDGNGKLHVSDFGLAFLLNGKQNMVEKLGTQSGTLRYMAPERLSRGVNDFSTDIYSLGAALYELISGTPVFQEDTPRRLIDRICSGPAPLLRCAEPDLAAIVNKCLSFDPAERYADMAQLAADLRHFLDNEPVTAARPGMCRRFFLWTKRSPLAAALLFTALLALVGFIAALVTGLCRTKAALALAEKNAAAADAVLNRSFKRISELPSSAENNRLLAGLLPYYTAIARQKGAPAETLLRANGIIALCAMNTGNFARAEAACRAMLKLRREPRTVNLLAEILRKQNKAEASEKLSREVAGSCSGSPERALKLEAVRALLNLAALGKKDAQSAAFGLLEELLAEMPDDPEFRFQYARLLGRDPGLFRRKTIPGVEPNALVLLLDLAEKYPEDTRYALETVKLMSKRLRWSRTNRRFQGRYWRELLDTVELSERLLGRSPNDPDVLESVIALHTGFLKLLRARGNPAEAARSTNRLQAILEIFFFNPESSDAVKEQLIGLQLERLSDLRELNRKFELQTLENKISKELKVYKGPRAAAFRAQLDALRNKERK